MPYDMILIVNPVSGGGRGRQIAKIAATSLKKHGITVDVLYTEKQGDAATIARQAIHDHIPRVVACGGDGTVHEIIGAIAQTEIELGLLPCGRGNDLARALGIPSNPIKATRILHEGTVKRMDLGKVNAHYFSTVVTMGFDSEVAKLVYDKAVPFSGTVAYLLGVFKMLLNYKGTQVTLTGDFGTVNQSVLLTATGNTPFYGGGMKITPDAIWDDNKLDVCRVDMMSRFQIMMLLPKVFWGGHVSHPKVTISRTKSLALETSSPVWLFADGEPVCQTPADIQVVEKALSIICEK